MTREIDRHRGWGLKESPPQKLGQSRRIDVTLAGSLSYPDSPGEYTDSPFITESEFPQSYYDEQDKERMDEIKKTEEELDDVVSDVEKVNVERIKAYGEIFDQLILHDRFNNFIACNYEIKFATDEDANEIRPVVLEFEAEEVEHRLKGLFKTPEGEVDIKIPTAEEIKQVIGK